MKYLFKLTVTATDTWSPFYRRSIAGKLKPLYYVADSKEHAIQMAERNLQSGLKVKSVSKLAKQLADYIYSANDF